MSDVIEINVMTGERVERDFTPSESAQRAKDQAADDEAAKAAAKKETETQQARDAAIEHAKSLGFTDAMIAVMYPNLGAQNE